MKTVELSEGETKKLSKDKIIYKEVDGEEVEIRYAHTEVGYKTSFVVNNSQHIKVLDGRNIIVENSNGETLKLVLKR
jgi:hypothetical protein